MAQIKHHNRKPILKFKTKHATEIIADLDIGLKMLEEDFNQRKEEFLFQKMLDEYLPDSKEEILRRKYSGGN